jgi:phosphoribosylformylglycinamidine synthase
VGLGTPIVSGNVSFYNETEEQNVPPTPTIAMVGLLDDVERHLQPYFQEAGDVVLLLGQARDELGGSEYLAVLHGIESGTPPWIDLDDERRLHRVVLRAAADGLLRSAHDVADGGLAVALAECCFGRGLGVRIEIEIGMRRDAFLFGESQSRMLVSVQRGRAKRLRDLCEAERVPCALLGEVEGDRLIVTGHVDAPVRELRARWRAAFGHLVGA